VNAFCSSPAKRKRTSRTASHSPQRRWGISSTALVHGLRAVPRLARGRPPLRPPRAPSRRWGWRSAPSRRA
jgi:hypothetical protein